MKPPDIDCEKIHPGLVVADINEAVKFYTEKLGFICAFTWGEPPTFAGVNFGGQQMFLQKGTPDPRGCSVYFLIDDADALHDYHIANGVEIAAPPGDREYGIRDYSVRDLHGYYLTFGHNIFNIGPAIEIERVGVPVRLEKRLAALLHDLAAYKRLSLSSCLEEILLHTNDGAGPHTDRQVRYIQELKKKHGIDYDSHGSYRFVEK